MGDRENKIKSHPFNKNVVGTAVRIAIIKLSSDACVYVSLFFVITAAATINVIRFHSSFLNPCVCFEEKKRKKNMLEILEGKPT